MQKKITAIIPAAGKGTRMGAEINKVFLEVLGHSVFAWTLRAFEDCTVIHEIVVVTGEEDIFLCRDIIAEEGFTKVRAVLRGGATRAASVYAGISAAEDASMVVIHDAARPLVTPEIIERVVQSAEEHGAAIVAVPVVDTIKETENGFITKTVKRDKLYGAQTPQVFARQTILHAIEKYGEDITDDASAAEQAGIPVAIVAGSYENIKVTTPFDMAVCEMILRRRG
ncbi:MAG: 2-C-methyl-D-erythritol 4-phosphate cytidylyltransferase [Clostridia bacterium]|nr:2-C-methyl-D-erythritol 4-phosphate cytidylyltransferase [Clostridia bacterium]